MDDPNALVDKRKNCGKKRFFIILLTIKIIIGTKSGKIGENISLVVIPWVNWSQYINEQVLENILKRILRR